MLSFLDINVHKDGSVFHTGLYRKPTFTGLTTKFHSAVSDIYKYNLINCLVSRAFKICSTDAFFGKELDNIRRILCQNDFPSRIVNDCIRVRLENIYSSKGENFNAPIRKIFILVYRTYPRYPTVMLNLR